MDIIKRGNARIPESRPPIGDTCGIRVAQGNDLRIRQGLQSADVFDAHHSRADDGITQRAVAGSYGDGHYATVDNE